LKSKKPKLPTIEELEQEKRTLYVSKSNIKRLNDVVEKLNYIYYGIVPKK
jgi:SepF-like predicted cell division protein (DUF552 family)